MKVDRIINDALRRDYVEVGRDVREQVEATRNLLDDMIYLNWSGDW